MNERNYKKKCEALFLKANKLNVELEFSPENFNYRRLDCLWYGGQIARIKVSDTFSIEVKVEGDVRACLINSNCDVIVSVKDRDNCGAFADTMKAHLKTDRQLYAALDSKKLILDEQNWIEYDGVVKKDVFDEQGTNIDLGMMRDNFLDNNVLLAIEQVLDSIDEIKAEIIDIAEIEYNIKVGGV